jgi:two-component system response regulator
MSESSVPLQPAEILLVEDNEDDIELTRIAFESVRFVNNLNVVRDGVEAMEYLRNEGSFQNTTRPDLILLDLNMPRMDGRELLAVLKQDEKLRQIPVVVLSTSETTKDVFQAYDLHANSYLAKPVRFDEFVKLTAELGLYWFALAKRPKKSDSPSP